jgi:hypothetical protein
MNGEGAQNWQQFRGSELGSVLAGIYGSKPKINYPVPKVAKNAFDPSKQSFRPVNARVVHGAQDPRKTTRRDASSLLVPKHFHGANGQDPNQLDAAGPISFIPHRRGAAEIWKEMEEQSERQRHYRPAARRVIGDTEKDRYSQICAYKGGKALMAELTPPPSEAPFELEAKQRAAQLESKFRTSRKGLSARDANANANGAAAAASKAPLTAKQQLAAQIQSEIDERCEHLESMRGLAGTLSKADIAAMQADIKRRTLELIALQE